MALRDYAGNAKPSNLTAGITNTALAFSIPPADAASWPTGGANGKFVTTLDRGLPSEERILVSSQSGGACTIASLADRGLDGTSAVAHSPGPVGTAEHTFSSFDAEEANAHINNVALDNHTQYMMTSGTRHDLTARHAAGSVVPTAIANDLVVGQSAGEGAGTNAARATHAHGVPKGTPVAVGTVLAQGAAGLFSDSAHVHELGVGSVDAANLFGAGVVDSNALGALSVIAGKIAAGAINNTNMFTNSSVPPTAIGITVNTYTPTLYNAAIGTGGTPTNTAMYVKLGRIVIVWGIIILGSSGGDVTGDLGIGLPAGQDAYDPSIPAFCYLGAAQGLDGTTRWASVGVIRPDTQPDRIQAFGTAGQSWDQTNPFNWGSGDLIRWFAAYITPTV